MCHSYYFARSSILIRFMFTWDAEMKVASVGLKESFSDGDLAKSSDAMEKKPLLIKLRSSVCFLT